MMESTCETGLQQGCHGEYADMGHSPAPCQEGCPVGTDIPSYVGLIWQGDLASAFEVITAQNPFSSICGRVCAMPCEARCRRGESDGAVAIRNLKRYVTERFGATHRLPPVTVTQKKTVGVVGAGPAGLTAAQDLAEAGYAVHVYEKTDRLGGMMTWGIPLFRLPRRFIEQDITRMLEHCPGIEIHFNCALGRDITLDQLRDRHDAVLLATGLWEDRRLGVPGEKEVTEGIHGIDFMVRINRGEKIRLEGRVVVVGGGNVAVDMARTALRAGASEVHLYCLESRAEMPAWEHEIQEALQEGILIHPSWGPRKILHEWGRATGVEFMRCTSVFDDEGRFNPSYDPGATSTVHCNALLLAIGLTGKNEELEKRGLLERGRVKGDFETMGTGIPGVFAAGDGAFGPSAIIYAVHHGHRVAHYMKAFLEEQADPEPYAVIYSTRGVPVAQDPLWEKLAREELPVCGMGDDPSAMEECTLTYDAEMAVRQAARCLRCDAETGTANYSRRTRDFIHAMARTEPGQTDRLRTIFMAQLIPRENPFPPERPAHLDDLVFLPAALTRLVIDPYREHCSTETHLGKSIALKQPMLFTGFDNAAPEVRKALAGALLSSGCGYVGFRPPWRDAEESHGESCTGRIPWLQLIVPGNGKPHPDADGLVHVTRGPFRPVSLNRLRENQVLGISASASVLPQVIPFALEEGLDFLILDGTPGIVHFPSCELAGLPDLTVLRDAIRILRDLNREEELHLLYFGGLRSGTDVAKVLAINCNAGIFGVAMGIAMGGVLENGTLRHRDAYTVEELQLAAVNWIKATADEAAIIARCTGKTNVHNLEPEDMRTITLATEEATGIPLASGRPPREYF